MNRVYQIPVSFTFTGKVYVKAKTKEEAAEIVLTDFGMNSGEITTGVYDDEIKNWDINMIADKSINRQKIKVK